MRNAWEYTDKSKQRAAYYDAGSQTTIVVDSERKEIVFKHKDDDFPFLVLSKNERGDSYVIKYAEHNYAWDASMVRGFMRSAVDHSEDELSHIFSSCPVTLKFAPFKRRFTRQHFGKLFLQDVGIPVNGSLEARLN